MRSRDWTVASHRIASPMAARTGCDAATRPPMTKLARTARRPATRNLIEIVVRFFPLLRGPRGPRRAGRADSLTASGGGRTPGSPGRPALPGARFGPRVATRGQPAVFSRRCRRRDASIPRQMRSRYPSGSPAVRGGAFSRLSDATGSQCPTLSGTWLARPATRDGWADSERGGAAALVLGHGAV